MPEVNHCVGDRFHRVVQMTEPFEPDQQPLKFILPRENPLDGIKTLSENGGIKNGFTASFGGSPVAIIEGDVGFHALVKDNLAVCPTVVNPVQTHD